MQKNLLENLSTLVKSVSAVVQGTPRFPDFCCGFSLICCGIAVE